MLAPGPNNGDLISWRGHQHVSATIPVRACTAERRRARLQLRAVRALIVSNGAPPLPPTLSALTARIIVAG
jgi:hypothetical protein